MKTRHWWLLAMVVLVGLPILAQYTNPRFGIFYHQTVDSDHEVYAYHDALTGQEFVCVELNTGGAYKASGVSCYLTGRNWK